MPKKKERNPEAEEQQKVNVEQTAFRTDEELPQPSAFVQRGGSEAKEQKRRISFPVTVDGKVDWSTLRDKGKSELVDVLKSDPEIARLTGQKSLEEEFPFQFTDKDARLALGVLNQVNSFTSRFFFARFKNFQIDSDIADQAFQLAKDDSDVLAERGARLANKYSGGWLRRHADLVMFLGLYMKCVTQQTITAVTLQADRNERKLRQVRPNGGAQQQRPVAMEPLPTSE